MKILRLASTTVDVSGFAKVQTGYLANDGKRLEFNNNGNDKIEKYWKLNEVVYKRIPTPLIFLAGETTSYTWDGVSLTAFNHSNSDYQPLGAIIFKGKYYLLAHDGLLKVSSDLLSWTSTGEYLLTIASDGNTLAGVVAGSVNIRYSTDGVNWNTKSGWTTNPYRINSVRWLAEISKWVAVGYYDSDGFGMWKPWMAESGSLGGTWTEQELPSAGDYETSWLDVWYSGASYRTIAYVAGYSNRYHFYSSATLSGWGQYGDYYSQVSYSLSTSRGSIAIDGRPVATPNAKIIAPLAGYEAYLLGSSYQSLWAVYPPGQDKNGEAYFIDYDNSSYYLKNSAGTTLATVPTPVLAVGGVR